MRNQNPHKALFYKGYPMTGGQEVAGSSPVIPIT